MLLILYHFFLGYTVSRTAGKPWLCSHGSGFDYPVFFDIGHVNAFIVYLVGLLQIFTVTKRRIFSESDPPLLSVLSGCVFKKHRFACLLLDAGMSLTSDRGDRDRNFPAGCTQSWGFIFTSYLKPIVLDQMSRNRCNPIELHWIPRWHYLCHLRIYFLLEV